jgi:hypothetical protein
MIKFTPGKWVANYKGTIGHIKALTGIKTKTGIDWTPTICRIDTDLISPSLTIEEINANARLIAAAPDMYEALCIASDVIDPLEYPESTRLIAAALKKAEGEGE